MLTELFSLPTGQMVADFYGQWCYSPSQSRQFEGSSALAMELPSLRAEARRRRRTLVVSVLDAEGLREEVARFSFVPNPR